MDKGQTLSDTEPLAPHADEAVAGPQLVVAMECERPLRLPSRHSLAAIDEVIVGRGEPRGWDRYQRDGRRYLRITIPSKRMSSVHLRMIRQRDHWRLEDAGSKNGTFVDGEPVRTLRLAESALIEAGRTLFLFTAAVAGGDEPEDIDLHPLHNSRHDDASRGDAPSGDGDSDSAVAETRRPLLTLAPGLAREYRRLERIARSGLPVLILGDTGTGKEVAARALHSRSQRSGPFIGVNCGALPESLIESELFGHKRGAFSGANEDRPGLFRSADRGTIFLDEIAELPPSSQVALLRVLQEGEVRPVGGTGVVKVAVRVVAATLRDLPGRVADGSFREDLYARLAGITIRLPPLRERREDIGLLCAILLGRMASDGRAGGAGPTGPEAVDPARVRIDRAAARALFSYSWPRNVRELEHALAAALALADGHAIEFGNLPEGVRTAIDNPGPPSNLEVAQVSVSADTAETADKPVRPPLSNAADRVLYDQLVALLTEHRGNVSAAARAMGKAPMQLYRWFRRLGIDIDRYR